MAFDTFAPATPQLGTDFVFDERVLENAYGDGYGQGAPDGLNAQFAAGTLRWNAATTAQLAYIQSVWQSHGKTLPFLWTIPGEGAPRQWKFTSQISVQQLAKRPDGSRLYAVSVAIKESFEVG